MPLSDIFSFLLSVLQQVLNLYFQNPVLSAFFTLWLLDRIFGIFDVLRSRR